MGASKFVVSFRCYFPGRENYTTHRQRMPLTDVQRWVECYKFTHPNVKSITVKIWFHGEDESA